MKHFSTQKFNTCLIVPFPNSLRMTLFNFYHYISCRSGRLEFKFNLQNYLHRSEDFSLKKLIGIINIQLVGLINDSIHTSMWITQITGKLRHNFLLRVDSEQKRLTQITVNDVSVQSQF